MRITKLATLKVRFHYSMNLIEIDPDYYSAYMLAGQANVYWLEMIKRHMRRFQTVLEGMNMIRSFNFLQGNVR